MKKRNFIKSLVSLCVAPAVAKPTPVFLGHYTTIPVSTGNMYMIRTAQGLFFCGSRFSVQTMPVINSNK